LQSRRDRLARWRQFEPEDILLAIGWYLQPLRFHIQEGEVGDWSRIVDTSLPSPEDISEPGSEILLPSLDYEVSPRSVVVLSRRFCET
jgi:isoamylase